MLASEYGWSLRDITEDLYIEDVLRLMPAMEERNRRDRLMELAIAHNPHKKDPNELVARLRGESILEGAKLDKTAMEQFKDKIAQKSGKMKIK